MPLFNFLASVFIAIFLIISDTKFSYLDTIKRSIANLISPIYLVVDFPAQLYVWINDRGTSKQTLLDQNKQLNNELARLNARLQKHHSLLLDNKKLAQLLNVSHTLEDRNFIVARISHINQSRLKQQIIINKGSNDGVKLGQVALGALGVVGQITQVTALYSTLLMITDPTQYVPVKNERNGIRGISKGMTSRQGKLLVNFIESGLDVKVGDLFLSSHIGGKFPSGYPVGKVTRIKKTDTHPFLHIELTPIQPIQNLELILIKQ